MSVYKRIVGFAFLSSVFSTGPVLAQAVEGQQPKAAPLGDWVSISAPSTWGEEVHSCASWSWGGDWFVDMIDGGTVVYDSQLSPGIYRVLPPDIYDRLDLERDVGSEVHVEVFDGTLVGFDHGEWGSSLWWISRSRDEFYQIADSDEVGDGNPITFFEQDGLVTLVTGLAHMGGRGGDIVSLNHEDGRWNLGSRTKIGTAAHIALEHPSLGILIIGIDGIYSFADKELRKLADIKIGTITGRRNAFVLERDGTVLVGFRYVVLKISPTREGAELTWLAPPSCPILRRKQRRPRIICECVGT